MPSYEPTVEWDEIVLTAFHGAVQATTLAESEVWEERVPRGSVRFGSVRFGSGSLRDKGDFYLFLDLTNMCGRPVLVALIPGQQVGRSMEDLHNIIVIAVYTFFTTYRMCNVGVCLACFFSVPERMQTLLRYAAKGLPQPPNAQPRPARRTSVVQELPPPARM